MRNTIRTLIRERGFVPTPTSFVKGYPDSPRLLCRGHRWRQWRSPIPRRYQIPAPCRCAFTDLDGLRIGGMKEPNEESIQNQIMHCPPSFQDFFLLPTTYLAPRRRLVLLSKLFRFHP